MYVTFHRKGTTTPWAVFKSIPSHAYVTFHRMSIVAYVFKSNKILVASLDTAAALSLLKQQLSLLQLQLQHLI
jgi:hypothetical protein